MSVNKPLTLSKYSRISAIILGMGLGNAQLSEAQAFTANEVLNKMKPTERGAYLAGIIDGMAQVRWVRDKPDNTGSRCIREWYYSDTGASTKRLSAWFGRHLDKPSGALVYVLVKKECGA